MKQYISILKKATLLLNEAPDTPVRHYIRQIQANAMAVLALMGYPIDFDQEAHFLEYSVPIQYLKDALGEAFPVIYDLNHKRTELNLLSDISPKQTMNSFVPETIEESMERILKTSSVSSVVSPSASVLPMDPTTDEAFRNQTDETKKETDEAIEEVDEIEETEIEEAETEETETEKPETEETGNERPKENEEMGKVKTEEPIEPEIEELEEIEEEIEEDTDDEVEEISETDDEPENKEETLETVTDNQAIQKDPYESITTHSKASITDTVEKNGEIKEEERDEATEEPDLIDEDSDENIEEVNTDNEIKENNASDDTEDEQETESAEEKAMRQVAMLSQVFGGSHYEPAPLVETDLIYGKDYLGVPPMPKTEKHPEEENEFKPYLHKNDLTFVYDYVTVTTGGRKEEAELIIYPLHKDGNDIIVWCLFNGKTTVRYSGEKAQVLVPLLNTRLLVSGQFVDNEFFTQVRLPKKDKARGDTLNIDEDAWNGKEGHVASYDIENEIEVHVFPTTFKNNQTKNADYFYYVRMDDEIQTGDTNDNPFVYIQTESHNLEVVARWDETKDLIGLYVQDNI